MNRSDRIRLYVNVDHVATLRQARRTVEPDPLEAALLAQRAGAHGITVHLREDRRHIQDQDVFRIKEAIHTPLNLEMAPVEEMIRIALKTQPDQVSLVPEKRQEITTEGGLDVKGQEDSIAAMRERLAHAGIKFSLFVDPEPEQIDAAFRVGARSVEINTGAFSECRTQEQRTPWVAKIRQTARYASNRGLRVFAGHGLTTDNVGCIAAIPEIEELNIGHHLVSRSVFVGLENAIREMREAMDRGAAASLSDPGFS